MRKSTYFLSLLLTALFLLPWSGVKAETLTVADGTTLRQRLPMYGYYGDEAQHNQFIFLSSELSDMSGATITGLTFYMDKNYTWKNNNAPTATFRFAEVTATLVSPMITVDETFKQVFSGTIVFANNEWNITLDQAYTYNGGNLVIDVQTTAAQYINNNSNKGSYFYSANVAYGRGNYNGSAAQEYIPKTTFTYEAPAGGCSKPSNLTKSANTPDGATFTWDEQTGVSLYQWACVAKDAEVSSWNTLAENVLTKTIDGLTAGTSYDFHVRSYCGDGEGEQSASVKLNFTPTVPAPTYGANPVSDKTHNSATVTWAAATGITKYQYVCVLKNATPDWTGVEAKEATSAALSNLNELTDYDFYVRSWYSATAQSAAVKTSFTTNADCSAKTVDALHDWTEDFTNQTTNAMPSCWTAAGNTSAVYVASSGYVTFSTGKALYFTGGSGTEAIAILPEFSNDLNTLQIAFSHIEESNTKSGQIKLGYYKNSAFQSLKTYGYSTSWKNESAYALSGIPEGARLAFSYTPVNSAWTAAIDNITVSLAPSCANPTGLTVGEIETTSAQVTWTSEADNFALQYKADTTGAEWVNATGEIASPFTLSNLKPNETPYLVRVKAICTSSESDWVTLAQPFKTDCEAKSIGWSENFDGALSCWSKDNNWTVYTYNGHSGSNSMRFNASSAGNLILPAITLNAKAQLSFWHSSTSVTCSVYANSVAEENKLAEFAKNGEGWKKDSVDLSAFNGQTVTLIIRGNYVADKRYLYIDDVAVTALPCEAPTNLTVATGATTATLAWESNETAWTLQYKAEGDADWTEEAVNAKSFKLTNLTVATNYQARVQSACGSEFTDVVEFSTWCAAQEISLPLNQTFGTSVPACWTSATATPLAVQDNYLYITGVAEQIAVLPLYNIDLRTLSITLNYSASGSLDLGYINNSDEYVSLNVELADGKEIDLASAPAYARLAIKYTGANANSASISSVYLRKTPTCLKPVISLVDADKESAAIAWTGSNAESWNLQYKLASAASWSASIPVTENPYTLEGLAQGTTYKVRVQGACSDEDSDWSDEAQFTTACDVIAALPFTETFDAALSNCWKIYSENTSTYAAQVYNGALNLPGGKTGAGHVVVLPEITASLAKASLTITYSATVYQPEVGYVTDATDASTFAPIEALNLSSSATTAYVALATVPANAHIALRYAGTGTSEGACAVEELRVSRVEIFNDDDDANEARLTTLKTEGATINDLVLNRTLLMNGDYNTLCLPFSLSAEQLAESPLAGLKLKAFDMASVENEELLIAISDASSIEAGVPYFIAYQGNEANRATHIFHDVTIAASAPGDVTKDGVAYQGVFNPVDLLAQGELDDHDQLFLAAGNKIYWPAQDKTVKGFRAYFNVNLSETGPLQIKAGMPARIVERTGVATGCENINAADQAIKLLENNQVVIIRNGVKYSVQGQVISK